LRIHRKHTKEEIHKINTFQDVISFTFTTLK
jgi:hypothetical protein